MTLSRETVVFDVTDAHVYPLLTDVVGASPTYGAAVDVPGISQVSLNPNITSAELKGDARVIARRGRIDRLQFQADYSKLSLAVLDTLLGSSTLTDTGTTPNQVSTLTLASPGSTVYFKFEFQVLDVDTGLGSLNVALFKCALTGGTLFQTSTDNFGKPTLQAEGIAIDGTIAGTVNPIATLALHETAAALSS